MTANGNRGTVPELASVGRMPRAAIRPPVSVGRVPRAATRLASGPAILVLIVLALAFPAVGEEPALKLRASAIGAGVTGAPFTIELFRWSTEAERTPLLTALSAPAPAPPAAPAATADAGRGTTAPGAGGRAGRGGRGGRGAAPPPNPVARLTAAVKAAPTLGFIWGDGVTGYSIKYAWRTASTAGGERIVLVTDRRLGVNAQDRPPASAPAVSTPTADAEFMLIEMRVGSTGVGEGKTSLDANIVVDATAQTLALDGYQAAPPLLKVTR